ncbi:MAG: glycosyltransferase family 2 protein, partial [Microthrixaceae bacterium]
MPDTERTPPRVRVVVLNWNSWWFSRRCLRALAETDYPADRYQVVLVDNASVDGSLERLLHEFPDLQVVRNEVNLGFAEGCNRAMRDLDHVDMVALVNNDAMVEPGWLAAMADALDGHPGAGAAAARLVLEPAFVRLSVEVHGAPVQVRSVSVDGVDATSRTRFGGAARSEGRIEWPMELEHVLDGPAEVLVPVGEGEHEVAVELAGPAEVTLRCGDRSSETLQAGGADGADLQLRVQSNDVRIELLNGLGTERNQVGESYDRHFGEPSDPEAVPELAGPPIEVTGFSGGGVLLRTEVLAEVGLFDPRFFAYYEDSDLSWRSARAGWTTVTAPGAVIRHAFGGSGGSRAPGFFFLNYRNWLLTVVRNAEPALRRAAWASARERVRWAVRANVASPLKHRRAPSWDLVVAWLRTLAGVAAVRLAARRDRSTLPGAQPTGSVVAAFQPEFSPRGPSRRPGGPTLVALDVGPESSQRQGRGDTGVAGRFLAALATADLSLDVVAVRAT